MKKLVAAAAAAALLAVSAPAEADVRQPEISIRGVLDLPYNSPKTGAKVFQVTGTTVGGGAELRPADVIASTEGRWGGDLEVDLNPVTRQLTVTAPDTDSFQYVAVRVTSPQLRLWTKVEDTLVVDDDGLSTPRPVEVVQLSASTFELRWQTKTTDPDKYIRTTGGQTVFTYRHVSSLSSGAKAGKRKVRFSPRLSVFGLDAPNGSVKVYEGSRYRGTIKLIKGAGTRVFSAKKGKRTFSLKYAGSSSAAPVTKKVSVRVR